MNTTSVSNDTLLKYKTDLRKEINTLKEPKTIVASKVFSTEKKQIVMIKFK